jgi:hypothetical protein
MGAVSRHLSRGPGWIHRELRTYRKSDRGQSLLPSINQCRLAGCSWVGAFFCGTHQRQACASSYRLTALECTGGILPWYHTGNVSVPVDILELIRRLLPYSKHSTGCAIASHRIIPIARVGRGAADSIPQQLGRQCRFLQGHNSTAQTRKEAQSNLI